MISNQSSKIKDQSTKTTHIEHPFLSEWEEERQPANACEQERPARDQKSNYKIQSTKTEPNQGNKWEINLKNPCSFIVHVLSSIRETRERIGEPGIILSTLGKTRARLLLIFLEDLTMLI